MGFTVNTNYSSNSVGVSRNTESTPDISDSWDSQAVGVLRDTKANLETLGSNSKVSRNVSDVREDYNATTKTLSSYVTANPLDEARKTRVKSSISDFMASGSTETSSLDELVQNPNMTFFAILEIMLSLFDAVNGSLHAEAQNVSEHADLIKFNNNLQEVVNSLNDITDFKVNGKEEPGVTLADNMVDYIEGRNLDDPVVGCLGKFVDFINKNIDSDFVTKIKKAEADGDTTGVKAIIDAAMEKLNSRIKAMHDKLNPDAPFIPFNIQDCTRDDAGFKKFNQAIKALGDSCTNIATQATSINQDDSALLQTLQQSVSTAASLLEKVLATNKEVANAIAR